jgi:hypothetical protein
MNAHFTLEQPRDAPGAGEAALVNDDQLYCPGAVM